MYKFSEVKKSFWPALSFYLIYFFAVLSISIIIQLETNWSVYSFVFIMSLGISPLRSFLDKLFWDSWQGLPALPISGFR